MKESDEITFVTGLKETELQRCTNCNSKTVTTKKNRDQLYCLNSYQNVKSCKISSLRESTQNKEHFCTFCGIKLGFVWGDFTEELCVGCDEKLKNRRGKIEFDFEHRNTNLSAFITPICSRCGKPKSIEKQFHSVGYGYNEVYDLCKNCHTEFSDFKNKQKQNQLKVDTQ